jgi:tRNA pseudouridine13 synthase
LSESTRPPKSDVDSGLLVYSTDGPRRDGQLRSSLQDFRVEELLSIPDVEQEKASGLVPVYRVTKAGVDTPHVAREIAAMIKSEVNYAGLKDKNATVVQYMSARSTRASSPTELHGGRFEARLVGFSRPITRAMLTGNRFSIFLETGEELGSDIDLCFAACRERRLANFYGYQRFGLRGNVNRRAGEAIVKRDFSLAVRLILAEPREGEEEAAKEGRKLCGEERYADALAFFTPHQDLERRVASHLARKPGDHLGAIRTMPVSIRRLLVNSFQSYLFNLALSRALKNGIDISRAVAGDNWARVKGDGLSLGKVHGVRESIPSGESAVPLLQIVGYAYRNYGSRLDAALADVLKEERVSPGSFYIKEAEEMSSEGGFRSAPLLARDLSYRKEERGFAVEFSLGKGEYATVLMREVLKPENPRAAGF